MRTGILATATILVCLITSSAAQDGALQTGGDYFAAGQNTIISTAISHDAFLTGANVHLNAPVAGDTHIAGFDVELEQPIDGDLYAGGFTVKVHAPVGGDITAAGSSVLLAVGAATGGNVRVAGASVTISAPVAGTALVSADTLNLNSSIGGNLNFYGRAVNFGPGAIVTGSLTVHAPEQIEVPDSVAPEERVSYQRLDAPDYVGEMGRTAGSVVHIFWPAFWAAVAGIVLLLLVGGLFIALTPGLVRSLEVESAKRPLHKFGSGILVFAAVLGLVPLAAMTIVGLLLLPFLVLFVVAACLLAYLAGAYLIGTRVGAAFLTINTNLRRLAVLIVAVLVATGVGIIPFIGWLSILVLATIGFGSIASIFGGRSALIHRPMSGTSESVAG
jgi:hypothetical protein